MVAFPPLEVLRGSGRVGQAVRSKDWAQTELGPLENWSQGLLNVVSLILNSPFPLIVYWGAKLNVIFNDAYAAAKSMDLDGLGKPGLEVWPDVWHVVQPLLQMVFTGKAVCSEDQRQVVDRDGRLEECFFMWSYSPVRDEDGSVQGALAMSTETTARVVGERRLTTLSMLGYLSQDALSVSEACVRAARVMHEHSTDIAFTLLYLCDASGSKIVLQEAVGVDRTHAAAMPEISLTDTNTSGWPAAEAFAERTAVRMRDPEKMFGPVPGGPWPESPKVAVVCPIMKSAQEPPLGVLVVGINPRRAVNDDCVVFVDLLARQVAYNIGVARNHEEESQRSQVVRERFQSAFLSIVSQELKTPLALIVGPLEQVLANPGHGLHEEYKDRLGLVHRNATRLVRLVNSLIEFNRIQAGRLDVSFTGVHLGRFTADLAGVFRSAFESAGLQYEVVTESLQETVFVDLEAWEKIIFNLLSNAFKYTTEGKITVGMRRNDDCIELTVSDTGCGIAEADVPYLFEQFYCVAEPDSRTFSVSGIGLALCREFVKIHGGTLTAESELGKGSTFTVVLPLGSNHLPTDRVDAEPATEEATTTLCRAFAKEAWRMLRAPSGAGAPAGQSDPRRPRVLVVVQNPDMRKYLADLLSGLYRIDVAANGNEALAHVADMLPDVVVADTLMLQMGGLELIKVLRGNARSQGIPIILMSASAEDDARNEALAAGADDFLVTPCAASELLSRVKTQLQISGLRAEIDRLVTQRAHASVASEKRYRTLVQLSPVGAVLLDAQGHILFFNDKWADIMQRHTVAEADGWREGVHEDDRNDLAAVWQTSLDNHVPFQLEFRYRHNGPWTWVFAQSMPDVDETGTVRGFVMSFTDMTERKRLEQDRLDALALAASQADEHRREQARFVDIICHEIRNPLNGVINNVDVLRGVHQSTQTTLRQHAPTPDIAKMLKDLDQTADLWDAIELCTNHQRRITDDVLNFSRLHNGQFSLAPTTFSLQRLTDAVVRMFLTEADAADVHLTMTCTPQALAVPRLRADAQRIAQILVNLIANAIKFTKNAAIRKVNIEVDIEPPQPQVGGTAHVVFRVRDTGIGMTNEQQARLFVPFSQASNKTYNQYGGSGMGLFISRALLTLMGGTIDVDSEPAKGATFTVAVSCERVSDDTPLDGDIISESASLAALSIPRTASAASAKPRYSVLIVEDNDVNRNILRRQLQTAAGGIFDIALASDGQQAVEATADHDFDLIIMDAEMPVMGGLEATAKIRQRERNHNRPPAVIIGLSGNARQEHVDAALAVGMTDYLAKPCRQPALLACIARHLHIELS